jgi:hypothetical protein
LIDDVSFEQDITHTLFELFLITESFLFLVGETKSTWYCGHYWPIDQPWMMMMMIVEQLVE